MCLNQEGNCFDNSSNPVWVRNCPSTPLCRTSAVSTGVLWNWSCFGDGGNMLNIPTQAFPAPGSQQRVSPSGQSGRNKVTAEQRDDWRRQKVQRIINLSLQIWLWSRLELNDVTLSPWLKQSNHTGRTRRTLQWQAYGSCTIRNHVSFSIFWKSSSQGFKFDVVYAFK